ncbi:hypothetical protein KKC74_07840, partial [bacterium]|nr:hypothetical protein [bacterium]
KYLDNRDWMHNRTKHKRDSKLDPFIGNIEAWLEDDILYTGTWIYDHLISLGFNGSVMLT